MPAFDQDTLRAIGTTDAEWRAVAREAAYEAFVDTEMPDDSAEIWRYIELGFDLDDYAPATEAGVPLQDDPLLAVCDTAATVQIIDGYWVGDDVDAGGVTVASLARSSSVKPELIESGEPLEPPGPLV